MQVIAKSQSLFGSIHNWGIEKEYLNFKRLERTYLRFLYICIIIIVLDFFMPIDQMVSH